MVQKGDQFPSIEAAREAIRRDILDDGESYNLLKSNQQKYILVCKAAKDGCKFRIRASRSSKGLVSVTILVPHSCRPTTHYNNRQTNSVW
jgi:hypothetical protein